MAFPKPRILIVDMAKISQEKGYKGRSHFFFLGLDFLFLLTVSLLSGLRFFGWEEEESIGSGVSGSSCRVPGCWVSGSVGEDEDSGVDAGGALGTRAHAMTEDLVGISSAARACGSIAGRRLPVSAGRGAEGIGLYGTGAALGVAAAGSGSAGVTGGSGAGVSIGVTSSSGAAGTVAGSSCATAGGGRCSFTSSNSSSSSSSSSSLTSVAVASSSVASSSIVEPASELSPKGRSSSSIWFSSSRLGGGSSRSGLVSGTRDHE